MPSIPSIRLIGFSVALLIPWIACPQSAPGADRTADLQMAIDQLPPNGVLDCGGQEYAVTVLRLKSNSGIRNCIFDELPGAMDFAAPVTIDGRSEAQSGITIRNVQVKGNRAGQTNIGYAAQENGGRHCFRLLGRVSDVVIDHSSGTYCATDGIALVSYGVGTSDSPDDLPFRNITIRNSDFSFNRRHGASADGVAGVTFDHVTFLQNGTTLPGGEEGDACDSVGGQCYGTGFWYEDYKTGASGEGLSGLLFSACTFQNNFQRSMFFLSRERSSAPGFGVRGRIRIIDSYLDSGSHPLAEDYAIQFQVDDTMPAGMTIYQDIAVVNTILDGSLGFHDVDGVSVLSSSVRTTLPWLGYFAYSTNLAFRDVIPSAKQMSGSFDPSGQNSPVVSYAAAQPREKF